MNLIISRLILLRMRNVNFFFPKIVLFMRQRVKLLQSPAGHKWQHDTFGLRIPKATNTLSEYAILFAFPLQQNVARTRLNITL